MKARTGSLPLEQRLSGTMQARNQVVIFPEITGRVENVYVDDGDYVQRGQTLARLNSRMYEEQVRQAEADLKVQRAGAEQARARLRELESELRTTEQLARGEYVSQLELDRLRAQVDGARADLNRAEAVIEQAESTLAERKEALSQTVIRAPVAGRVGRRNAEQGMRVDGSTELFVVGDPSQMRVHVTLTERMMSFIDVGQRAVIHADNLDGRVLEAEVSRISPFLESGSFTTEATIDVDNVDGLLNPGMYVEVEIFYGESEEATLVPTSALHENPRTGTMGVFIASDVTRETWQVDGRNGGEVKLSDPTPIQYREVEVIARGRASAGVRGLSEDEWVVAVGQGMLSLDDNDANTSARTRPISWDRLMEMQEMQEDDLLRNFMNRHQEIVQSRREAERQSEQEQSTESSAI